MRRARCERLSVGVEAPDVLLGDAEFAKPGKCPLLVVELDERCPVVEGDEEGRIGNSDLDAALAEAQFGDHEVVEHADDIGARADDVPLVFEWPLEGAGAADALAALEHENALPLTRQIRRGRQSVVAAADDDDVPVAARPARRRGGEAELAQLFCDRVHRYYHREVTTFLRV